MLIRSKFWAKIDAEVKERPLSRISFSFNSHIIINIAFRDSLLEQYNNFNDAHSKWPLKKN